MDQERIGKFILEARHEVGLTQKELAERIGVSDRTISKWENGGSTPDIFYLQDLCDILKVTMNELISGEHLTEEAYRMKAEENIEMLIKENAKNVKNRAIIYTILCVLLCLYLIWFLGKVFQGSLIQKPDFIALNVDIILPIIMLLASGRLRYLRLIKNGRNLEPNERKDVISTLTLGIHAELISGGICTIVYLIHWFSNPDNAGYFGINLGNPLKGILYSLVISAVVLVIRERIS